MSRRGMLITITMIILIVVMVYIITTNEDNVTYAAGDTLASVVINQSKGTTWSSGASGVYNTIYTKEDGTTIGSDYRYIGDNVTNYVRFNNDMYQIIGVFDENTHGKIGQQLIKLIRTRMLGSFEWGVYNTSASSGTYYGKNNDWTGKQYSTPANLNIILNQYFLNKTDTSTTYGNCSDWTYFNNSNDYKTNDCQTLVGYGIDSSVRDYIETTTWHLNGYNDSSITLNNSYLCERGMYTGCTSANKGGADSSTIAKIGLIYPSDYAYTSGGHNSTSSASYSSATGTESWMFKGSEWTITPRYDNNSDVFYVTDDSMVQGYAYSHKNFRPTFYLKSSVYVTGGNGSFDNPYTVACDTCSSS